MPTPAREPIRLDELLRLHMRRRPGMYIGGANPRGLRSILDDIVTELLAAPGARPECVRCTLGGDGTCAVELRGGVMPAVEPEAFDADRVEFDPADPLFSLAVASALSESLHAEVVRADGRRWSRTFAAGTAAGTLEAVATTAAASPLIRIRYRPDAKVFDADMRAGFLPVCGRTRDRAAFHPHVRFTVDNEQDGQRRDFHYPDGLLSLAQELEYTWWDWFDPAPAVSRIWRCRLSEGTEAAEAVFVRRHCGPPVIHSFVNGHMRADGTHIDGLRAGVAEVAATFSDDPASSSWFLSHRRGPLAELTVLLSLRLDNPRWRGSTTDILDGHRPHDLVRRMVIEQLPGEIKRCADA